MAQYRIILRRAMGPANPDKDRKWLDTTVEQPSLTLAVAYLFHQLKNTSDSNVQQVTSVVIRAPRLLPTSVASPSPQSTQPQTHTKRGKA